VTVLLAFTAAVLFATGTYLVLQRKLSRIIIGLALLGHGANVLLVSSGRAGNAPIIGNGSMSDLADPLPQALALTAIVISFGTTSVLLALAYRSWMLTDDDEVQDDVEDDMIARQGAPDDELAGAGDPSDPDEPGVDAAGVDPAAGDEPAGRGVGASRSGDGTSEDGGR
jgi:multicomponent Na+:H+ antiporter subunit C